jgi:hypothetical protein
MTEQLKKYFPELTLANGEVYAGLVVSEEGFPQYHLILTQGEIFCCTWQTANEWVQSKGISLPTGKEFYILQANLKNHFKSSGGSDLCYWASDECNATKHRFHSFREGFQVDALNNYGMNARGVRRLAVETLIRTAPVVIAGQLTQSTH